MAEKEIPKCGRLLLKRAVSNEKALHINIRGKWKGTISVPQSSTVAIVKSHIAAASKIEADSQLLLFKGKKLDDPSRTVQELKIKSKSTLFLRCTKVQVVKPAVKPAPSPAAMELQQKLQNQGAGSISLRMAEDFVSLAKSLDVENPVVKGVNLFYKSNRNIAYARQIVKAEKEEKMKQAKEAAEKAAEKADKMEVDESSSNATTDASPKKKKKQTYKDMMKEFKLKKQSSEEAREAHREFLKKNLGGGHFDKLDKI